MKIKLNEFATKAVKESKNITEQNDNIKPNKYKPKIFNALNR